MKNCPVGAELTEGQLTEGQLTEGQLTEGQLARHDETNSRSGEFCERS